MAIDDKVKLGYNFLYGIRLMPGTPELLALQAHW